MELNATIHKTVNAIVEGPFIEDWEFQTVVGVTRAKLQAIASGDLALMDFTTKDVLRSAVSNLPGYPHGKEALLEQKYGLSKPQLEQLLIELER